MVEGIFDDVVDFSEIENFIDTQVKFYSSGMYVRLAFAVAVNVDPDILVVDEVLAVGTSASKPSASIESAPFKTRADRSCSSPTTPTRFARSAIARSCSTGDT